MWHLGVTNRTLDSKAVVVLLVVSVCTNNATPNTPCNVFLVVACVRSMVWTTLGVKVSSASVSRVRRRG